MNRMILPFAGDDFFQEGFEPIFKFSAIFGAGDHRAEVHGHERLVLQRLRHITADDASRQAFGDGGFAHAGFADQHRVVLRAPGQYLHHAANFFIAADHRIDFALARQGGEIAAIFFQRLKFIFGILVGDALIAAQFGQRLQHGIPLETVRLKNFLERRAAFVEQAQAADVRC